jgi:hypothetical protein
MGSTYALRSGYGATNRSAISALVGIIACLVVIANLIQGPTGAAIATLSARTVGRALSGIDHSRSSSSLDTRSGQPGGPGKNDRNDNDSHGASAANNRATAALSASYDLRGAHLAGPGFRLGVGLSSLRLSPSVHVASAQLSRSSSGARYGSGDLIESFRKVTTGDTGDRASPMELR